MPIENQWVEENAINLKKENNIICLPLKKRWLNLPTTNSYNYNGL
jgi:hypothetical protein